jgi:5-methylcytosine-specific restriction endonuclease McrA
MGRVLLLNATYEPLQLVSDRRAVVLLLVGRAEAVATHDEPRIIRSPRLSVTVPSIVRLTTLVRLPPHARIPPVTRRAVLARDRQRCAYCGEHADTVDHIVPRSRGGVHDWSNVVAACRRHNVEKGDRLLEELGWRLRHEPSAPQGLGAFPAARIVTARSALLIDVEPLRSLTRSTLGVLRSTEPLVVLGARQPPLELDADALIRDGIGTRRRRGGGGAVLLRPGDRWVELWLRAPPGPRDHDVRSAAYFIGSCWQEALATHGVAADLHRGALRDAAQGAVACFAGLGPGELTVRGHKVLGISQWRVREGSLISSVLAVEPPSDLLRYLSPVAAVVPRLGEAASILAVAPHLVVDQVLETFVDVVAKAAGSVVVDTLPFS